MGCYPNKWKEKWGPCIRVMNLVFCGSGSFICGKILWECLTFTKCQTQSFKITFSRSEMWIRMMFLALCRFFGLLTKHSSPCICYNQTKHSSSLMPLRFKKKILVADYKKLKTWSLWDCVLEISLNDLGASKQVWYVMINKVLLVDSSVFL